uniref:DDE-1 domain-containing protein n=1 Tax=Parasteatoda tepidariorum TaxID=114398 RepID=A0A2L2YKN8_PARTP
MVRSYQRKTDRSNLSEEIIEKAVKDVVLNNKSIREAAKQYNLTKSMLHKRVNIAKSQCKEFSACSVEEIDVKTTKVIGRNKYRCHQVFTDEEELLLSEYFLTSSKIHYGLTFLQARALAFQYAEKLGKAMPSSWNVKECAGIDWMQAFMKRHPGLSLRKPENTSLSRATSFNKKNVDEFFDNLYAVMEKYKFKPDRILNTDETGITTVLQSPKVIAQTGKKQVGQAVSGERGELVSFCGIVSATGNSIPPVFIFPRVKYKDYFLSDAPTGSLGLATKSGWMTKELFPTVLHHIKEHTKSDIENPILLLIDNHNSHISIQAITYAKENGITLLSFPPHCSHRLQPLDVAVYGAFKAACKVAFNDWLLNNPGKTVSIYNIPSLAAKAYYRSFTPTNIMSGFKKSGIFPLNRLAFGEEDFFCSYVTDRENPGSNANAAEHSVINEDLQENELEDDQTVLLQPTTPESVRPLPKAAPRKKKN